MTRNDILTTLRDYKAANAQKFGIEALGLFGSTARGETTGHSDLDLVVETSDPDLFTLVHIKDDVEKLLHCPVDLVRKHSNMNPFLKQRIEKDAIYV